METKEVISSFAHNLEAEGIPAEVTCIRLDRPEEAIAVIHCDRFLSAEESQRIIDSWKRVLAGTDLEGMKAAVFPKGVRLTIERP